jgi:PAS domain S-box-containing protein
MIKRALVSDFGSSVLGAAKNRENQIRQRTRTAAPPAKFKRTRQVLKLGGEKYRYLFEKSATGIGIADLAGNIIEANEAMRNITGYTRKELIGRVKLSDTYVDADERTRLLELLKKHGGVKNFVARLKNKKGAPYWASLSVKKIKINGKDFLLTQATDITESKRMGAAEIAADTIESMGDGVILHLMNGRIILVNPAYEKMTGYKKSELVGKNIRDLIPKIMKSGYVEKADEAVKTALKKTAPYTSPITITTKDGKEIPATRTVSFIKNAHEKPFVTVVVVRDISELKNTEENLKTKIKELEEFHDLVVGRELKMNKMEDELSRLKAEKLAKNEHQEK